MPTIDTMRNSRKWTRIFSMSVTSDEIDEMELYEGSTVRIILSGQEKTCIIRAHGHGENYSYKNGGKVADIEKIVKAIYRYENKGYKVLVLTCHPTTVAKTHPILEKYLFGIRENWDELVWHYYSKSEKVFEVWIEKERSRFAFLNDAKR